VGESLNFEDLGRDSGYIVCYVDLGDMVTGIRRRWHRGNRDSVAEPEKYLHEAWDNTHVLKNMFKIGFYVDLLTSALFYLVN
jgi:hypothetical protein